MTDVLAGPSGALAPARPGQGATSAHGAAGSDLGPGTVAQPRTGGQPGAGSRSRATAAERWRLGSVAVVVVALLVALTVLQGGYQPVVWLAAALAAVALWLWARLTFGPAPALAPLARAALVALALYAAWSYASIRWAADPGAAVSGSDRTLFYFVLFALGASLPWTARRLELALSAYTLALGTIAAATLVALARHPDPAALQAGALASPLGYHNATAALGTIGALSAILLSSSRRLAWPLRGALGAAACACLQMSLLADSRGWLYTLPLVLIAVLALAPRRGRACAWGLVPLGATLATLPWILRSYAPAGSLYGAASERASAVLYLGWARAALVAALAGGVAVGALARVDRDWRLGAGPRRAFRALGAAALGAALLALLGGAALLVADGTAARVMRQFTGDAAVRPGVVRFAQLGGDRYDFWRVGWQSFLAHPLGGLGQDNFAQAYTLARRSLEEPTWVHSLELRLLSGTGIVGFALFAAFTALALMAARRAGGDGANAARRRLVVAVALVPEVVWLVHGSFDWFWEIPALSGAAFWWLGAAAAGARRAHRREPASRWRAPRAAIGHPRRAGKAIAWPPRAIARPLRAAFTVAAAALAALALLALGSAYLGERAQAQASALAGSQPQRALAELRQARALEPFTYQPLALAAAIQLRLHRPAAALGEVAVGLARDRASWLLWFERSLAESAAGRPAAALAALARARGLDPREPVIALAQRRARSGRPLTIAQAQLMFAAHEREVVGA